MKYAVEYIINRFREDEEERIYKVYVTESIRLRNENKCITAKFTDLIDFDNFRNEKSAEEVKHDILEEFKRLSGGEQNGN